MDNEKLIKEPENWYSHVVLLGAGASKAALPNGDKNGKLVPLMNELPMILGDNWDSLVNKVGVPEGDFESQYSWLKKHGNYDAELKQVNKAIENYFSYLELPDEPTIYDYLVLGLRRKDLIATFNWDPFLMQAHKRNRLVGELPDIRFLHGSVNFLTCDEHDVLGTSNERCPICKEILNPVILFYPNEDKDYSTNKIMQREWDDVRSALNS